MNTQHELDPAVVAWLTTNKFERRHHWCWYLDLWVKETQQLECWKVTHRVSSIGLYRLDNIKLGRFSKKAWTLVASGPHSRITVKGPRLCGLKLRSSAFKPLRRF